MGMPFPNPVAAGGGALIIDSIHSPDYAAGSEGWTVNQDGSAEFNNLTIRGTFYGTDFEINTDGMFFYSPSPGAGNLIISFAAAAGTDAYGNTYGAGINAGNQSAGHVGIDLDGRLFAFNSADELIFELSAAIGQLNVYDTSGTLQAVLEGGSAPFGLIGPSQAWQPGAAGTSLEAWHSISITASGTPSGWAGYARVKRLSETNFCCLDLSITWTSALGSSASFTIGSLPNSNYYVDSAVASQRNLPGGLGGTATGSPQFRVLIPSTSAGIQLVDIPAGASRIDACLLYPVD